MTASGNPPASRFDTLPSGSDLVAIRGGVKALSREQKRFNKLVADIASARASLAATRDGVARINQRVLGELVPLARELAAVQRDLVFALDAISQRPKAKLTRRRRDALSHWIETLADELLDDDYADDAELLAVRERHGELSRAELAEMEASMLQAMVANVAGEEAARAFEPGASASSFDDMTEILREATAARDAEYRATLEREREQRAARRRKQGKGPTRAELAAQVRAQAEEAASQSLRTVFRKLASALHPDRATDAADQTRRTALMQRVNDAYARADLLDLLTLQLEIEQIDANHVDELPDERVRAFNHVLSEQLDRIKQETDELLFSVPATPQWFMRRPTLATLNASLTDEVSRRRGVIEDQRLEINQLNDNVWLNRQLDGIARELDTAAREFDTLQGLFAVGDDVFAEDDEALFAGHASPSGAPQPRQTGANAGRGAGKRKSSKARR